MKRFLIPLMIFALLLTVLAAGLQKDPRQLPSALIGKLAPTFDLPLLQTPGQRLSPQALRGQVWVLNVWASWCESCRDEHPVLLDFTTRRIAPVYGLNYKDEPQAALRWLADAGDPYSASIVDRQGRTGVDYGVYGVPEIFVIDRAGIIRYRLAGPLSQESLNNVIQPLIKKLQSEGVNG